MSKLRADITWKHRINFNSSIQTPFSIINDIEENNYMNIEKNVEKNVENIEENSEENLESEDEEDEEETNIPELEKEFGNYLQGWVEMLEEETSKFQNEEYEIDEIDESVTTDNIIHPAIDPDAKWKLESLFKDLKFPF